MIVTRAASVRNRVPSTCEPCTQLGALLPQPTDVVREDEYGYLRASAREYTASCHDRQIAGRAYDKGETRPIAHSVAIVYTGLPRRTHQLVSEPVCDCSQRDLSCGRTVIGVRRRRIAVRTQVDLTVGTKGTSLGRCFERRGTGLSYSLCVETSVGAVHSHVAFGIAQCPFALVDYASTRPARTDTGLEHELERVCHCVAVCV